MGGDFGDKKTSSETGSHFYNSNNTTTTVSGLPADNLILKPFQTELSQRALFLVKLFLVVLVLLLLVVNCLEFENVTFKLSFHYDRWILERKWSGKMPMRRHLNFIVKREEKNISNFFVISFPMANIEKMNKLCKKKKNMYIFYILHAQFKFFQT